MSYPIIISIEGIVGAGKTTFINNCLVEILTAKGFNVKIAREPVDLWVEILPMFYKDPKRWGYFFQTKALVDRIGVLTDAIKHDTNADIIICERGIVSDSIFMETMRQQEKVTEMEYTTYKALWDIVVKTILFTPNLYVYLSPDVNEAMKRVKIRSRDGEEDLAVGYQHILKLNHDKMFGDNFIDIGDNKVPVLKIDANLNFKDDYDTKLILTNKVISYI